MQFLFHLQDLLLTMRHLVSPYITNSLDRRTDFYQMNVVSSLASKSIRTEETKRLSLFPQGFLSGATERKS
jgi:hypothetical protein